MGSDGAARPGSWAGGLGWGHGSLRSGQFKGPMSIDGTLHGSRSLDATGKAVCQARPAPRWSASHGFRWKLRQCDQRGGLPQWREGGGDLGTGLIFEKPLFFLTLHFDGVAHGSIPQGPPSETPSRPPPPLLLHPCTTLIRFPRGAAFSL